MPRPWPFQKRKGGAPAHLGDMGATVYTESSLDPGATTIWI